MRIINIHAEKFEKFDVFDDIMIRMIAGSNFKQKKYSTQP